MTLTQQEAQPAAVATEILPFIQLPRSSSTNKPSGNASSGNKSGGKHVTKSVNAQPQPSIAIQISNNKNSPTNQAQQVLTPAEMYPPQQPQRQNSNANLSKGSHAPKSEHSQRDSAQRRPSLSKTSTSSSNMKSRGRSISPSGGSRRKTLRVQVAMRAFRYYLCGLRRGTENSNRREPAELSVSNQEGREQISSRKSGLPQNTDNQDSGRILQSRNTEESRNNSGESLHDSNYIGRTSSSALTEDDSLLSSTSGVLEDSLAAELERRRTISNEAQELLREEQGIAVDEVYSEDETNESDEPPVAVAIASDAPSDGLSNFVRLTPIGTVNAAGTAEVIFIAEAAEVPSIYSHVNSLNSNDQQQIQQRPVFPFPLASSNSGNTNAVLNDSASASFRSPSYDACENRDHQQNGQLMSLRSSSSDSINFDPPRDQFMNSRSTSSQQLMSQTIYSSSRSQSLIGLIPPPIVIPSNDNFMGMSNLPTPSQMSARSPTYGSGMVNHYSPPPLPASASNNYGMQSQYSSLHHTPNQHNFVPSPSVYHYLPSPTAAGLQSSISRSRSTSSDYTHMTYRPVDPHQRLINVDELQRRNHQQSSSDRIERENYDRAVQDSLSLASQRSREPSPGVIARMNDQMLARGIEESLSHNQQDMSWLAANGGQCSRSVTSVSQAPSTSSKSPRSPKAHKSPRHAVVHHEREVIHQQTVVAPEVKRGSVRQLVSAFEGNQAQSQQPVPRLSDSRQSSSSTLPKRSPKNADIPIPPTNNYTRPPVAYRSSSLLQQMSNIGLGNGNNNMYSSNNNNNNRPVQTLTRTYSDDSISTKGSLLEARLNHS